MATCCIVGCGNKVERRGKVKCYNIPTARSSRQFNVRRRKLWLEAIERANGSSEGLREDAVVCSEHFVSGQISLDISDQDFVPSVFPKEHLEKSRRRTLRPRSGGLPESPKVTPKKRPVRSATPENADHVLPENNYCEPLEVEEVLEEEEVSSQPLVKEDATLPPEKDEEEKEEEEEEEKEEEEKEEGEKEEGEKEEGEKEEGEKEEGEKEEGEKEEGEKEEGEKEEEEKEEEEKVTTQPLSSEVIIKEFVNLKNAKLEIKSLLDSLGRFRCDVCDGKFPSISALVKHKRLHEEEWSEGEGSEGEWSEEEWSEGEWSEEEGSEDEWSEDEWSEEEEIAPTVSEFLIKNEYSDELLSAPVSAKIEFQCNICHRSFPTTHSLKRHKLLHVRDPRKCRQCGTMFCKRHNHVVAHPQISTETTFEEAGTVGDMSETDSSIDNVDEGLKLLLRSDSAALEAIAAQSEAPAEVHKEAPAITYSPRKPGLLTAFKSFLGKKKQFKVQTEALTDSAQNTEVIQSNIMTSTAPNKTITSTAPVSLQNNITKAPCPDTAPAVSPVAVSTTNIIAMPEQSSKTHALTTSTNASTCQLANHVVYVTQQQNVGTVHLALAQPLVLKEYMPGFSKNDTGRSAATPQVVKREVQETNEFPADQRTILLKPAQIQKKTFVIPVCQPVVKPQKAPAVLKRPTSRLHHYLPQFKSNVMVPLPSIKPLKHPYEHGSRPPSPEPILTKIMKGPWDSLPRNYPKDFILPHLPQTPELPPELRMFSPQLLTSSWLNVKRNFDYILQK